MNIILLFLLSFAFFQLNIAVTTVADVDFATLQPTRGFQINGSPAWDSNGNSMNYAGDVNGDGVDDIIFGDYENSIVYVIFGKRSETLNINLANFDNTQGFRITGPESSEFGISVSYAGDMNGDTVDDIIIGTNQINAAYVIFGNREELPDINVDNIDSSQGFRIFDTDYGFGRAVSYAGDVNGDNIDDVIIGQPEAEPNAQTNAGVAYVIFGRSTESTDIDISAFDNNLGFRILGNENYGLGTAVSNAGDVNGDGVGDIIVGTDLANIVYVFFGSRDGLQDIDVTNFENDRGFQITGSVFGFGQTVSSAGDINGDNIGDIIFGSASEGDSQRGVAYIVFGNAEELPNINIAEFTTAQGFKVTGSAEVGLGYSVSNAGDANNDGIDDVIIGTQYDTNAFIVFGSQDGLPDIDIANFNSNQGFKITGFINGESRGTVVKYAGDINGDGTSDVLVGTGRYVSEEQHNNFAVAIFGGEPTFIEEPNQEPPSTGGEEPPPATSYESESDEEDAALLLLPVGQRQIIKTISQYQTTSSVAISASTASMQVIDAGSPSAAATILLVNQLQFIRYLNINYPQKLVYTFSKQGINTPSLNFGPFFPESLQDDATSIQAPSRFARFDIYAPFLANFWRGLTTTVILIMCICFVFVISRLTFQNKLLILVQEKARVFLIWGYIITFAMTNIDRVTLFAIIEYKSFSPHDGFTVVSLIINIICMIASLCLLFYIPKFLYTLRKTKKYQTAEDKIKAHGSMQVLFEKTKNKYFLQEIVLFVIGIRVFLSNIVIAALESPIVQASLLIVISVLMLTYLSLLRPHNSILNNINLIGFEITILIVNITCLYLATLESEDQKLAENAANVIIACNIAALAFSMILTGIELGFTAYKLLKPYLIKPKSKNTTETSPQSFAKKDPSTSPSKAKCEAECEQHSEKEEQGSVVSLGSIPEIGSETEGSKGAGSSTNVVSIEIKTNAPHVDPKAHPSLGIPEEIVKPNETRLHQSVDPKSLSILH